MNRSRFTAQACAAAIAIIDTAFFSTAGAAGADHAKHTVSHELGKPLTEAHADVEKGRFKEAIAKLREADASPKKTPWDQHIINELLLYAYARTNDYRDAARVMEATIADGFTEPAEVNKRVEELAKINYQLEDYGKAIQYGERAVKGGFADNTTYTLVSQAYYLKGDYKDARRFTSGLVDQEVRRGEVPKETQLDIVVNSCVKLNDNVCTTAALERMVTYYPKPEYWQNLIDALYQTKQAESDDADMLNIYRLANAVGAIKRPQEYTEMAQLALEQGFPGEAQRVLEKAFAQNAFTDPKMRERSTRLLEKAKRESISDRASLPKLQQDAAAAGAGDRYVAVGLAYLSYENYDNAINALQQGITKGGLKDPAQARLLLGVAQLKAGDRDAAVKTLHDVKGSDPVLERLATLWSIYAREAVGNARGA